MLLINSGVIIGTQGLPDFFDIVTNIILKFLIYIIDYYICYQWNQGQRQRFLYRAPRNWTKGPSTFNQGPFKPSTGVPSTQEVKLFFAKARKCLINDLSVIDEIRETQLERN